MPDPLTPTDTLDDAVHGVAAYDPNTQTAPACVVWTNEKSEGKCFFGVDFSLGAFDLSRSTSYQPRWRNR